jgi:hypothetical protein
MYITVDEKHLKKWFHEFQNCYTYNFSLLQNYIYIDYTVQEKLQSSVAEIIVRFPLSGPFLISILVTILPF